MPWRIAKLILLLLLLASAIHVLSQERLPEAIRIRVSAEGRLATQRKLDMRSATFEDLLLLPKVSDTLAQNMLLAKDKVINASCGLSDAEKYKALELVHGIGDKTAKTFGGYLNFSCR